MALKVMLIGGHAGPRELARFRIEAEAVARLQHPNIVLKCLRKEPERRYASAAELADELVRFQKGEPILARPVGRIEQGRKWAKRNPVLTGAVAAVALSLVAGIVVAWWFALAAEASARLARANETTAIQEKDKAQRNLAVATLLRVASIYENDPGGARALLEDVEAIRADLRDPAWGFYHNFCRRIVRDLPGHPKAVLSVAWSPDGKTLASASQDFTVKLWDVVSGNGCSTLKGHTSMLTAVAWSPDGKTLASAGWDQTILFWEMASGKNTATINAHNAAVTAIAWGADGKKLASISAGDRTLKLWDVDSGQARVTLKSPAAFRGLT